jgi:uncharacterized membrane protein YdbT with pleckstrin-like domain
MEYKKIWDKVLNPNEEIKYEFSVGKSYRRTMMWGYIIIGILFLIPPVTFIGIVAIFIGLFCYGWYAKVANAYAFTDHRVLIHKGWLSTKLISTEYQKITDVIIIEPFLSRVFLKAGSIGINTAGTGSEEIVLRYVENPYEIKKKLDELRTNR